MGNTEYLLPPQWHNWQCSKWDCFANTIWFTTWYCSVTHFILFVCPLYIPWFLVYKVCDTVIRYCDTIHSKFLFCLYIHCTLTDFLYIRCVYIDFQSLWLLVHFVNICDCFLFHYVSFETSVKSIWSLPQGREVLCDFGDSLYYTPADHGLTWQCGINHYLISHGWISFRFQE